VVETLYRHAYTVHPYQHMTIGSMHDLDNARLDDVRDFYNTYYQPNNATLVVVGDLDGQEAESMIRKYFGPLERGARLPPNHIPPEPPQTAKRVVKLDLNVALPAFVEGYHMPADGTPDAYPLRLASNILSEGESSRIYRRLVYEKQIALEAQSTGNFTEDPNLFFVFAVMNQGHAPAEGEAEVEAELARLKTQPVSDEELQKAKNQTLRDFILSRQTVQTRGEELGYAAVILKDANLVNTELARFLAVSPADIQRVAQKYFVAENMTLVEVYPKSTASDRPASEQRAGGR
jgi:predicted Zn-dependent peptidase